MIPGVTRPPYGVRVLAAVKPVNFRATVVLSVPESRRRSVQARRRGMAANTAAVQFCIGLQHTHQALYLYFDRSKVDHCVQFGQHRLGMPHSWPRLGEGEGEGPRLPQPGAVRLPDYGRKIDRHWSIGAEPSRQGDDKGNDNG